MAGANSQLTISNSVPCPVCQSQAKEKRLISKEFITDALACYYNEDIPDLQIVDYHQYRCTKCTLEFFWPMQPGSERFYEFISHQPGYYPHDRWEWQESLVRGVRTGQEKLLEIGCGNGDFLRKARKFGLSDATGIDTSPSAISVCCARGLNAWCGSISEYLSAHPDMVHQYDIVTSYHCLEHVPDPVKFLEEAKKLVKASGSIFLSTPYSPMSFESNWYDPLNHPPHHLSRWNKRAYEALAEMVELAVRFYLPPAAGVIKRTVQAFYIGAEARFTQVSRKKMLTYFSANMRGFINEYKNQKGRDKIDGKYTADLVLVEFKKVI